MQKSMKRLLSVLAVLALVLTMAPAGILAVETKAETTQSAVPADVAAKMATEAAKQTAALELIDSLEGATQAERLASLNAKGAACPFCGAESPSWKVLSTASAQAGWALNYLNTGSYKHIYVYGDFTHTEVNSVLLDAHQANMFGCMLMDDANIVTNGRIRLQGADSVLNIGGRGTFTSTLASINASVTGQATIVQTAANTLNLYGGHFTTSYTGDKEMHRGVIRLDHADATLNIWSDDVVIGPDAPTAYATAGAKARMNLLVYSGTANIYAGTVQNAYAKFGSQGWNVMLQTTGAKVNMYGGTIKGGSGVSGIVGGNVCFYAAGEFNMYGGTISGGSASYGGNVYVKGGKALLNGTIKNGTAATQGGNVHVCESATLELGNVTITGGVTPASSSLSSNVRIGTATLKLSGNAHANGILMTSADSLVVTPNFSGDVTVWHTTAVVPGAAIPKSSATGAFTGVVRNSNWLYTAAANGRDAVYIPVAMEWDGATGLKYAAQGVVYNGTLTPAANGQAAVDAYVAAMADETVEEKPQYVYITEDVQLKDGAEVAIWAGADITVSGNGVVAGVDRKNDNYAANGAAITVADQVTVAKEVTAGGRRYIALSDATVDANKYTFHRVETKLTNVTVNVANAGIYYKAEYQFDEIVKDRIASYGVNVNLEGSTKEGQTSSSDMSIYDAESHTLTAKSHGVYGIFKDTNLASTNKENGQIKLCGNPYLAIDTTGNMEPSDCPEFTAAESTKMSLADAMEMANEKWEAINEEGKPMLKEFFTKWLEAGAWDAEWAAKLTNLIPAEA